MDEKRRSGSREIAGDGVQVERVAGVPARGRGAVAASILGAFLVGAYFAASPGGLRALPGTFLVNASVLAVAFWFPALRIGSLADLARQWKGLVLWILAWTMVWDLATSGILLRRELFQEWWVVYPAGFITLAGLLALHGAVMGWTERRARRVGADPTAEPPHGRRAGADPTAEPPHDRHTDSEPERPPR